MPVGALVTIPELASEGPARITQEKADFLGLRFLVSGAELTQEARAVVRLCLLPGTRVVVGGESDDRHGRVSGRGVARDQRSGLLVYGVIWEAGGEAAVREDGITALPAPADPLERLLVVAFDDLRPIPGSRPTAPVRNEPWGPMAFAARERLLAWREEALAAGGGILALAGARVEPLPHQLQAVRTVLADRQVRYLLADEVGLGKTIEAGLILQSLLALRPGMRVLVVVPGALVGQWFLELFVRFGGRRFLMIDGERLAGLDGNPWAENDLVIASARAVEDLDGKAAIQFAKTRWDALVIDECHRMRPDGMLYRRLALISKATPNVLLLSATPGRARTDAWLALLHLLQPQVWARDAHDRLLERWRTQDRLVELLRRTSAGSVDAALHADWTKLLTGDPVGCAFADRARKGDRDAAASLVAHAREHHHLDRRVIRRSRERLARLQNEAGGGPGLTLAVRSREILSYVPDERELAVRTALDAYVRILLDAHAGAPPPRLAHWLISLHQAACHPTSVQPLLRMRATVLEEPEAYEDYRRRARVGETAATVLRADLSEGEAATHLAVSAACHVDPGLESAPLEDLSQAVAAWATRAARHGTARLNALGKRLKEFWIEHPGEKVLIFTAHNTAVAGLAETLERIFGDNSVATFGAHQDALGREESARIFAKHPGCGMMVCDPLGGEGRNFQFASVVVHHDLPWSLAAVEQRIGRVDRLGRDGDVPSWVLTPGDAHLDGVWATCLDTAEAFTRGAAGLEFALDAFEAGSLDSGLRGPAELTAKIPDLVAALTRERDAAHLREQGSIDEDVASYVDAVALAKRAAAVRAPADACARWAKCLGGQGKREDEMPRAWRLRARGGDQPARGVFDRVTALAHHDLAFFAPGQDLIDRLLEQASLATWTTATAWRRPPTTTCEKWDGLRTVHVLVADPMAIAAAGLGLEILRRVPELAIAPRLLLFVRSEDKQVETAEPVLTHLATPFDSRTGDAPLSTAGDRETWTRPLIGGQAAKVVAWQEALGAAAIVAAAEAGRRLAGERETLLNALSTRLNATVAAADGVAASAAARFGPDHPDTVSAAAEAEVERRTRDALLAAVTGARVELDSAAYLVVG